jgi:cation diffusion facilitator CzcD-associated flavoprotein CzcO
VGSGFSGLAMAIALLRAGRRDFVILERAGELGGTWRDNTYPGCACDVPSHLYSFSFALNPDWSTTYSGQAEIFDYLRQVAVREGVLPFLRFGCALREARWDEEAGRWTLETSRGALSARILVAATGALCEPLIPKLPGLGGFRGKLFHSSAWDHDHELRGERVAVIGTGASAIQFVPQIQPKLGRLYLFQRTPPWIVPRVERPVTQLERALYRRVPTAQRLMRNAIFWQRELYAHLFLRERLSWIIELGARLHLRRQVRDPALRARLTPGYSPGCKRILRSNDYYPALTRPNVELVCEGISEVRERAILTSDGKAREIDTLILGTGFRATDYPVSELLRGRDGRLLSERWAGSPRALRGTMVAGFPNLFLLLGPNTGLGHNSVMVMVEAQVGYILQALAHLGPRGALEARPEAQQAWNEEVDRRMRGTVWADGGCQSWYLDHTGRNGAIWPDFSFRFVQALQRYDPAEHQAPP